MLLRDPELAGIVEGRTDLVLRCWKRPTVRAGGTLRTRRWLLAIHAVDPVERSALTDTDARRSGHTDLADLLDDIGDREGQLYRVHVTCAGDDPRIARRNAADLTPDDRRSIDAALARLDRASPRGAWTTTFLTLIRDHEGVRAPELAAGLGWETVVFKRSVRRLKELGLTESLKVGYRLSPRGVAYLGSPPGWEAI
jgi:hypothetical protein